MTGIFDSGRGGVLVAKELRELLPREDIILLCDRANSPYGVKTRGELIRLAEQNIRHLEELGATRVLIGCCTASTVYPYLDSKVKKIAIPIISHIADAAVRKSKSGRIGVIATEATISSGAFRKELRLRGCYDVTELHMQWLVGAIEGGLSDESYTEYDIKRLKEELRPIMAHGVDTLILGCTHFPVISGLIREIVGDEIKIVSSAYEGARELMKISDSQGYSITKYIST